MNDKLNLLRRFFSNKYSRNDYLELKELLLIQDTDLETLMESHWNEFNQEEPRKKTDLSELLVLLNHEIDEKPKTQFGKKLYVNFSRIAAILILPLLLALGILYFQFNQYLNQKEVYVEVSSPAGSRTTLNLPDGSTVWLNGESSISYPAVFNENRQVNIQGEAFFKVHSDLEHPFLVGAKDIYVKATGTQFNVSAYDDDPEISVILKEGKVAVLDKSQSKLKEMESGYQLCYHESTSSIDYKKINATSYSGWIDGKLIFENANMEEVVDRIERWYGVDIEIVDKELLKLHFKATFINESIEGALKLLQSTATFNYRFAKREAREDGSLENTIIYFTKN